MFGKIDEDEEVVEATRCVCTVLSNSATLWAVARQAPLSMGLFRQEYCSELPFPTPGDVPDPEIEPASLEAPALQADSLPAELSGLAAAAAKSLQSWGPQMLEVRASIQLRTQRTKDSKHAQWGRSL